VPAHQIGKNLILHWNSEDGGEKSFMEHIQFTQGKMKKEKKKRLLLCIAFFLLPPSPHQEKNFPQYFSLIKERPKTYSHQKNPDRMSMFDPGVVAAAGPKRKKKN